MNRPDLILHFLAGYVIADLAGKVIPVWWIVLLIVTAIGTGKELWDKYKEKETFDLLDLGLTFAGGFFKVWINTL